MGPSLPRYREGRKDETEYRALTGLWGLSSIHRDHPPLPRGAVAAGLQLPPSVGTRPRGTSVQRLSVRTIMVRG
ncbi:hypothetical protein F750_0217 [Streptomyces sp. PAMC 26508]|nr:hypothetical protein F750_0217 [Streptomyces sp. PAMC 26508]